MNAESLNVVVIYESFAAGKRAKEAFDYLAQRMELPEDCQPILWKFDVLCEPKFQDAAARDALEADMIIVSARAAAALPSEVKNLLNQWLEVPESCATALVAILDHTHGEEKDSGFSLVREDLQRLAERAQIDFFTNAPENGDADLDFSTSRISHRADYVSSTLEDMLAIGSPTPRWGVSE